MARRVFVQYAKRLLPERRAACGDDVRLNGQCNFLNGDGMAVEARRRVDRVQRGAGHAVFRQFIVQRRRLAARPHDDRRLAVRTGKIEIVAETEAAAAQCVSRVPWRAARRAESSGP